MLYVIILSTGRAPIISFVSREVETHTITLNEISGEMSRNGSDGRENVYLCRKRTVPLSAKRKCRRYAVGTTRVLEKKACRMKMA